MLAAMDRRRFLRTSLTSTCLASAGLATLAVPTGAALLPERASAQARRAAPPAPSLRAGWSASGPREGREPADVARLTADERLHVPVLTLPELVRGGRAFDLVVQAGLDAHPMEAAHHIDWIEVCADDARALISDLSPFVPYAVVRVPLVLAADTELRVRVHCTLHGAWLTRRQVRVG